MVTSTTTREYGLYGAPPHSDRCPERDQNEIRTGSEREGHQVHVGFAAQHRQSPSRAGRAPGREHFSLRLVHQTPVVELLALQHDRDRKSTRLNSSHVAISYAVFCLKKKTSTNT